MKGLTKRQEETLSFIRSFRARNGIAPTLRELSEGLGIKPESVRDVLDALERKGEIRRLHGRGRGILLTGQEAAMSERVQVPFFPSEPLPETLSCGSDRHCYLERELYTNDVFAFRVSSESMLDAGIIPGDLVFLTKDLSALHDGSIVLVPADEFGNPELRRYRRLPYYIELAPENETMGIVKATSIRIYGLLIKSERLYN